MMKYSMRRIALLSWILIFQESYSFRPLPPSAAKSHHVFSAFNSVSTSNELFVADGEDTSESEKNMIAQERHLRFSGVGRLYTEQSAKQVSGERDLPPHLEVMERLAASQVAVIGLGGVGSWAAEALCRSGVGSLVLVDLDDICVSNTNRQLHALSSTVGQMKLDEMKRRLSDINPQCNITLIHDFVSRDNVNEILDSAGNGLTALLDSMDGTKEKAALLAACVERRIPVITCGASAGRMDPTKIVVEDLARVSDDRLLANCRRNLRKFYDFEEGYSFSEMRKLKKQPRNWRILAVTSTEPPRQVCQSDISSFRRCDGPLGTACFVTGSFGFIAASRLVEMIANNKLVRPRGQGKRPMDFPTSTAERIQA
jgi:tRNA A37 threonylcarbamoyladenosine dehydratase